MRSFESMTSMERSLEADVGGVFALKVLSQIDELQSMAASFMLASAPPTEYEIWSEIFGATTAGLEIVEYCCTRSDRLKSVNK